MLNENLWFLELHGNAFNQEKLYLNQKVIIEKLQSKGKNYLTEDSVDIELQSSIVKFIYFNTRLNNHPVLNQWFDFLKNSMYINCILNGGFTKSYNPSIISEQNIDKYAENNDAIDLNKFNPRESQNIEKMYLNGVFDGMPKYNKEITDK